MDLGMKNDTKNYNFLSKMVDVMWEIKLVHAHK